MLEATRKVVISILAVALSVFTIYEVNYGTLPPLKQLSVFALLGTVLCFIIYPLHKRFEKIGWLRIVDMVLGALFVACCGYLLWEGDALTNDRVGHAGGRRFGSDE